ncbi:MAG TPA: NAD-dependent succinate-semialdehyde dehydrogenase [Acidimicrobiia bacterium]|nr:NAD-dependent succinate-semialdehyde dehydrogenase [Acidimicrobiia bacterium]
MAATELVDRLTDSGHDRLLIGGEWRPASDQAEIEVLDPASGSGLAKVASGSAEDAVAAVAAAHSVAAEWAATAPRRRAEILRRSFELMSERSDELAALIVAEMGKTFAESKGEIAYAAEFFRWFSEEAVRNLGSVSIAPNGDKRILAVHQPIGVSLLITPWNFPAAMATRKIGPAVAAGCTMILKPASDTPLTALAIGALMEEAGLPAGVLNVLPSRRSSEVVPVMLNDPRVRKLSFTGSTEVGRGLLAQAAETIVSSSMELGGNAPFLVFDDADIDAAVEGAMIAKMRNGGQSCIAANRFLVHAAVADRFSNALSEAMASLKVGPGMDSGVDLGPLINQGAQDDMVESVDIATGSGGKVATGGHAPDRPGYYFEPTVLTGIAPDAPLLEREIFGPIAPVVTFDADDEAIALANDTVHGLAAYVYSTDLARALGVAEALESGMVGVNRGLISDPAAPFGGVKQSGLGREGAHEGMQAFLETKYIAASW